MMRAWIHRGSLGLCLGLGLLPGMARAGWTVTDDDTVYEIDTDLIQRLAAETIVDQVELPSAGEWREFWTLVEQALQADSLEDLAALSGLAQKAVSYLQAMPSAQPVQAWLRQRQDYFDMARQATLLYPGPAPARLSAPPPGSGSGPRALLVPPRPPAVSVPGPVMQKRLAYLRSRESWARKLRGRFKPDEAAVLMPVLKTAFEAEGVPAAWVWLAEVESGLNARARSPVGAAGLFQLMPATAEQYGLRLKPQDERLLPEKSARAAARCLKALHGQFGCWPLALAAYNAGAGRVARALKKNGADSFDRIADQLPLETQMYVPRVLATVALREQVDPAALPPPRAAAEQGRPLAASRSP